MAALPLELLGLLAFDVVLLRGTKVFFLEDPQIRFWAGLPVQKFGPSEQASGPPGKKLRMYFWPNTIITAGLREKSDNILLAQHYYRSGLPGKKASSM